MFRKVLPLVVAPLLVVTACADEAEPGAIQVHTDDAAVSALHAAPDAAVEAGSARFEMVIGGTTPGESFEMTANGAFDTATRQMAMTMDMGALFDQWAESSGEAVPEGLGGAWELVADGDTFYMRVPMFEMFTGTSGWLSMSPEDLGVTAEGLGLGAGTYDPSKILESLRGVSGEPEVVGPEDVRGVATTHYRAAVSLSEALAKAPEAQREQLEASLGQLGDLESAEIPVDIWIDGDDLVRRMAIDVGGAVAGLAGDDVSMTMTVELFDYGEPVDIEIPPADEVTPFSEVMPGRGGGGMGS